MTEIERQKDTVKIQIASSTVIHRSKSCCNDGCNIEAEKTHWQLVGIRWPAPGRPPFRNLRFVPHTAAGRLGYQRGKEDQQRQRAKEMCRKMCPYAALPWVCMPSRAGEQGVEEQQQPRQSPLLAGGEG